jgi:hypothetical protein
MAIDTATMLPHGFMLNLLRGDEDAESGGREGVVAAHLPWSDFLK